MDRPMHSDIPPLPVCKDEQWSLYHAPPTASITGQVPYFTPGHHRPGSIYTLSRASFSSQIGQLMSLVIPDADSLSTKISSLQTARTAARALIGAADQIKVWTTKTSEVIDGLDSDDDVEWAAAGGRDGLNDVENAMALFERLITTYVGAIEDLQSRSDIADVAVDDLPIAMIQMDEIIVEWAKIRFYLQNVKKQVEIAMEWEELWDIVLGDIQNEKDELVRLVFEMEERRHQSIDSAMTPRDPTVDNGNISDAIDDNLTLSKLSVSYQQATPCLDRSQILTNLPSPSSPSISQDDSRLFALFARMQPLRASLDFLPMRLSAFEARARDIFPTACDELQDRRSTLDMDYKQLERDAEALRKELGEDRWLLVFRGAGRQAQKMCESVERAVMKLREAQSLSHDLNGQTFSKKIENYEAKRTHYGPAIERIINIIDKGVKDRVTVNGEILRLYDEVKTRWSKLQEQMEDADVMLEELYTCTTKAGSPIRDSSSSITSAGHTAASGHGTPGSSPPSSVVTPIFGLGPATPVSGTNYDRNPGRAVTANGRLLMPISQNSKIPQQKHSPTRASKAVVHDKPWNLYVTNPSKITISHNHMFPTPQPSRSVSSTLPNSTCSVSPARQSLPAEDPRERTNPGLITQSNLSGSRPSFRGRSINVGRQTKTRLASTLASSRRASSVFPMNQAEGEPTQPIRPASSLAVGHGRRHSLLPQLSSAAPSPSASAIGCVSPAPSGSRFTRQRIGSNSPAKELPLRPRWRP